MMNRFCKEQITKKTAILLFNMEWWKTCTPEEIVSFQLFQKRLCMPFDEYHKTMEKVLNRSVWTHEFAYQEELVKEYLGEKSMPSFDDIVGLLPKGVIIITAHEND